MNHLLKMLDLTPTQINDILNLADQLKYEQKHGISHRLLEGKTLGMVFQKSSTRTRVSFEVGMYQLGGQALFLSSHDLQIGRGEPVEDTARVLSRYLNAIMIRTYEQREVEDLAKYGSIPVINGLTDFAHPCQVLADLMTIREVKGRLDGLKLCFIGDGNNMMNSLIVGALKCGMKVAVACPEGYEPDRSVIEFAAQVGGFEMYRDPRGAARAADVVCRLTEARRLPPPCLKLTPTRSSRKPRIVCTPRRPCLSSCSARRSNLFLNQTYFFRLCAVFRSKTHTVGFFLREL